MERKELIDRLRKMKPEIKGLVCMGCGYEHSCSVHGCNVLNEAIARLTVDAHREVQNDR